MRRVFLVNPAVATLGYSFITPRWMFVLAAATPTERCGDPVLIDESLIRFDAKLAGPGDIVGIGISSGNCQAGYRVMREAKKQGATVIMGGIHTTIFPDEPLTMGADAVVTGNGDIVWRQVVLDALDGRLQRRYNGGRVPGEALLKARWDLLDPAKYMFASVQTVVGCPENCSFCSVWVTEGRRPRQRLGEKIIEEANELYRLGFRYIVFADDNFNPATVGRIAREPSAEKRRELERVREERLRFFEEYHRAVPANLYGFTQMTAEVISDPEYLRAMYEKMRIRTGIIGIESFTEAGLASANKRWNPVGEAMMAAVRQVQDAGIIVLASIICGLESDTPETLATMRDFAARSGALLAQFTIYNPLPGTKDYYEMMNDRKRVQIAGYKPKHQTQILHEQFWLRTEKPVFLFRHAHMTSEELLRANQECWRAFYSPGQIRRRIRYGMASAWHPAGKFCYFLLCLAFRRIYAGHGVSADSVTKKKGWWTRTLIKSGVAIFNRFYRQRSVGFDAAAIGQDGATAA